MKDDQRAKRLMISSIAKLSRKSLSADNTINAETQPSHMVERRRFLMIRTRLIARYALQLVMASDTRILYRQVKLGHPDSCIMIRRGLIKPYSAQFSGFAWSFVSSSSSDSKSSNSPSRYCLLLSELSLMLMKTWRSSINHPN